MTDPVTIIGVGLAVAATGYVCGVTESEVETERRLGLAVSEYRASDPPRLTGRVMAEPDDRRLGGYISGAPPGDEDDPDHEEHAIRYTLDPERSPDGPTSPDVDRGGMPTVDGEPIGAEPGRVESWDEGNTCGKLNTEASRAPSVEDDPTGDELPAVPEPEEWARLWGAFGAAGLGDEDGDESRRPRLTSQKVAESDTSGGRGWGDDVERNVPPESVDASDYTDHTIREMVREGVGPFGPRGENDE